MSPLPARARPARVRKGGLPQRPVHMDGARQELSAKADIAFSEPRIHSPGLGRRDYRIRLSAGIIRSCPTPEHATLALGHPTRVARPMWTRRPDPILSPPGTTSVPLPESAGHAPAR